MTKTEDGSEFPREAYAYVGDPDKVETWKLRIWETPEKKITVAQLGRAAAALSPGGFRGQPADIPEADMAKVMAKVRAEYKKLDAEPPASIAASEFPRFLIDLSELAIKEGLTRVPLAKIGRFWKGKQLIPMTRQLLADVVANFRKRKARGADPTAGDVIVDYEHASENPDVAMGGMVPAAGWVKEIENEPDKAGILWALVEFTEKARAAIVSKELKYLSPFIDPAFRDKLSGDPQGPTLTSVALTGKPFQEWLPAIALSDGWLVEEPSTERREVMVKQLILADRATGTVRAVFEDGTEKVLPVEGLTPEVKPKVLQLSDVKRTTDGRFDFTALAELPGDTIVASEVIHAMTVQQELDAAVKETKILPAQRAHYEKLALSDLAGFRDLVKTMPRQIDLSERGIAGAGTDLNDIQKIDTQISELVGQKQAQEKTLSFGQAYKMVLSERPDLAQARARLIK